MIDPRTTHEMTGAVNLRDVRQSNHGITADEHDLALTIAYEMAEQAGINLDAMIAAQRQSETAYKARMDEAGRLGRIFEG